MSVDVITRLQGVDELSSSLVAAARGYGTPAYVMDMVAVAWAAEQVEAAFPGPWVLQYSLKANDLPAIPAFLAQRGWGGNVVSRGEWQHATDAGMANGSVSFEGIGKTDAELGFAVEETAAGRPPLWLAIESPEEAEVLADLARKARLGRDGRPALDVLLRLNPEVNPETRDEFAVGRSASKFGMTAAEIVSLVRDGALSGQRLNSGLRVRGVHVHAGSALSDVAAWAQAGVRAVRMLAVITEFADHADTVDFGGGFPLPAPDAPAPAHFRAALDSALADAGLTLPPRPAIEPGRYLVGRAGWLVSSVLHARPADRGPADGRVPAPGDREPFGADRSPVAGLASARRPQLVLDGGMTEFMRPALYGSHHRAHALPAGRWPAGSTTEQDVEGPVCESTDSFGRHRLPPLRRGDLVAFEDVGAYGASLTSRYNGRPHPREVLVWPDGSLELCERAAITATEPSSWRTPPAESESVLPPS